MLVPCGVFSQGTFFVNDADSYRPIIVVKASPGNVHSAQISGGTASNSLAMYLVKNGTPSNVPVSCTYRMANDSLIMKPIAKLGEGLEFIIRYKTGNDTLEQQYFTPVQTPVFSTPTEVETVFPLTDSIPKNVLFFHLRFTQPMQASKLAFQNVGIYDENGKKFERLWRERSYWLDDNKLLVIMVHPGRVKRGIDLEIPYEVGKEYEFRVDGAFTDIYGKTVQQDFRKKFVVIEPDYEIPTVAFDRFVVQSSQTEQKIDLYFNDKMDHASIIDGVKILDPDGSEVEGLMTYVTDSHYEFVPMYDWKKGKYQIVFGEIVCDLAANRLNRLFEMDKSEEVLKDKDVIWEFEIK